MKIINLMPIPITYAPEGDLQRAIVFPVSGYIARLWEDKSDFTSVDYNGVTISIHQQALMGVEYVVSLDVEDIESNRRNLYEHLVSIYDDNDGEVMFIVNNVVAQKISLGWRSLVIAPATSNDGVIREDGKIIAVAKFNQFI